MSLLPRSLTLFRRSRLDREMDAEMRAHLEQETERNIARGMSPDEARGAARRAFGGLDQLKERERDARGLRWLDDTWRDLRYAARSLRKSPGFTIVAVLSLALGIGAGTSVFSLLNAVLLRALPVRTPHELRVVAWRGINPRLNNYTGMTEKLSGGVVVGSSFPYPAYREFRAHSPESVSVFAFLPMSRITVLAANEAMMTRGIMVSGNFFAEYGASTLLGRPLAKGDDEPGAAPAVVITHRMWERSFGLDPTAVGQTISLNQNAFTIIGVLPPKFVGPLPGGQEDFYVTFAAQPALAAYSPLDSANDWGVQVLARIGHEANEMQTRAAFAVMFRQVLSTSNTKMDAPDIALEDGARGAGRLMREAIAQPMQTLLGVVGVVVLIACANVAGLLLARGAARQHEFAVRTAIGASRWRLVRQSFAESLLLSVAAGGAGLLLSGWGKAGLLQRFGLPDNFLIEPRIDTSVLAFALGASLITAFIFGLVPAIRNSRVGPLAGLKSGMAARIPRQRLGKILVAAQVALCTLLVVGAGLMIRTFVNLVRTDPGFNPENVLLFSVSPGQSGYSGEALDQFYSEARRSVAAIPGVRLVALSTVSFVALDSSSRTFRARTTGFDIPDRSTQPGEHRQACPLDASDGLFATLGIPIVLGREFNASDTATSPPVAVVNETFARTFFGGENPIGRTFVLTYNRTRPITIVGVSRDAHYLRIRETVPPVMCFCSRQRDLNATVFVVRSVLPPLSLVPAARKAIAALDPTVPISEIRTQMELVANSTAQERLFASLCSGLAALALLLACFGLYGLMAYNVARRTAEFGVRMALGATRRHIAGPILREAALLAATGLAAGLPVALGIARLTQNQLYEVAPTDPVTISAGVLILLAVPVFAAGLPARRAARVDPMIALRAE